MFIVARHEGVQHGLKEQYVLVLADLKKNLESISKIF